MVGATAGLRLLPDGKADIILDKVRSWLAQFPFKVGSLFFFTACAIYCSVWLHESQFHPKEDVKILTGTDEGGFAWLTLNYLLGNLGKQESETVAAIDLGGGSVQVRSMQRKLTPPVQ